MTDNEVNSIPKGKARPLSAFIEEDFVKKQLNTEEKVLFYQAAS
jgi:hypothetical protein